MKTRRFSVLAKMTAMTIAAVMALLPSTYAAAQARHAAIRRALATPKPQLPDGWTQLLTPDEWKQVDKQRAKDAASKRPAKRLLSRKGKRYNRHLKRKAWVKLQQGLMQLRLNRVCLDCESNSACSLKRRRNCS